MKISEIIKDLQEKINPEYISKIKSLSESQVEETIKWSKGVAFDFVPFISMLSGSRLKPFLKKEPRNKKNCKKYIFNNAMELLRVESYGTNGKVMWVDYIDNTSLISVTLNNGDYDNYLKASKLFMDESGKVKFSASINSTGCFLHEYVYTGNCISSINAEMTSHDVVTTLEVVYSNGMPVNLSYIWNDKKVYKVV